MRNSDRTFSVFFCVDIVEDECWVFELWQSLCVSCVCGLDERDRNPRDFVRWRQLAFDDRQHVPDSIAGASLFDPISSVAAVNCPFGQLVGRFDSVRSHYADTRPSRSYSSQGEETEILFRLGTCVCGAPAGALNVARGCLHDDVCPVVITSCRVLVSKHAGQSRSISGAPDLCR